MNPIRALKRFKVTFHGLSITIAYRRMRHFQVCVGIFVVTE